MYIPDLPLPGRRRRAERKKHASPPQVINVAVVAGGIREIAGTEVLGTAEDGWRWGGLIYYAPADPAVVVPKKIGIGQTINLARPGAWLFLGAVIAIPLLLTGLLIAFAD